MSYPINQNIKPYQQKQQSQSQQQPQQQSATGVSAPNIDVQKVTQGVSNTVENSNNLVTQTMSKEQKDQNLTTILMLPIWFTISRVMEVFNKACASKFDAQGNTIKDSSLLDKVRIFGDNIDKNLEGPAFKRARASTAKAKIIWSKLVEKSPILTALFKTPAQPKNQMAKMMIIGTPAESANDGTQAFAAYVEFSKEGNGKIEIGKPENLKKLKITAEQLDEMMQNDYAHTDDIIKACDNVIKDPTAKKYVQLAESDVTLPFVPLRKAKAFIRDKVFGFFGENGKKTYTFLFGREIDFSELKNKLTYLKGLEGGPAKGTFGKLLPKLFLRTVEGLTNGTAGGKAAILMQAMCFADAAVRTKNAKKGDKGKTFAESCVNDLSYYLLAPLGMGIMYGVAGLKYLGASPARVRKFKKALEDFNKKAASGGFNSKADWKTARKAVNDVLGRKTNILKTDKFWIRQVKRIKNIIYKPLTLFGKAVSVGLETFYPYMSNKGGGSEIGNTLKQIKNTMTIKLGGVRFPLYMWLIAPVLAKIAVKACHLVIGRPSKSILDDENKKTDKKDLPPLIIPKQDATQTAQIAQPVQTAQSLQQVQSNQPKMNADNNQIASTPNENLINKYIRERNSVSNANSQSK